MKTMKTMAVMTFFLLSPFATNLAWAETTSGEKAGQVVTDVQDSAKKGVRNVKDATCEMINGKMECAGKKLMHKAHTGVDKVKNKAGKAKDKID